LSLGLGEAIDPDDLPPAARAPDDFRLARNIFFLRRDKLIELGNTR
jgi:hypothetical protein